MDLSVTTQTFQSDDQSWMANRHGHDDTRSITLDTSAFTAATHYPNGYFASGLALGRITATGLYGPYNNALTDGTDVLAGFLFTNVKPGLPTTVDVGGALFEHGRVVEANLPIAIDAPAKVDVAGRITFE